MIHQEKKERTQINKIRNERGESTIDTTQTQRIVRNYYKQPYAKKFENLVEMEKFLEKYNLPNLNEEEAGSLNRLMTAEEIEAVIKKLKPWTGHTKALYWTVSQDNFIKHLRKS